MYQLTLSDRELLMVNEIETKKWIFNHIFNHIGKSSYPVIRYRLKTLSKITKFIWKLQKWKQLNENQPYGMVHAPTYTLLLKLLFQS